MSANTDWAVVTASIDAFTKELSTISGKKVKFKLLADGMADPKLTQSLREHMVVHKKPVHFHFIVKGAHGYDVALHKFTLHQMNGCCGICVSTAVDTLADYRKKGINTLSIPLREKLAKQLGYTYMMATCIQDKVLYQPGNTKRAPVSHSTAGRALLKAGWTRKSAFVNRRTGNTVFTFMKELP